MVDTVKQNRDGDWYSCLSGGYGRVCTFSFPTRREAEGWGRVLDAQKEMQAEIDEDEDEESVTQSIAVGG